MRYSRGQTDAFRHAGLWLDRTVADDAVLRVENDPEALAFLGEERRWTYAELYAEAMAIGRGLNKLGLRRGDVVSFMVPNWPEASAINLAAALMGFAVNPIVPIYRAAETAAILADCRSRALFIPTLYRKFDYPGMIADILPALPELQHVITVRGTCEGLLSYDSLIDSGKGSDDGRAKVDPDAIKLILYTSGTTGKPKAVLHSHNTLARSIWASAAYWGTQPGDRIIMPSPVTHITGYSNGLERPLIEGTRTVLMESWDADQAVALIDRHAVAVTVGATPFLAELTRAAARAGSTLPSLRVFACGGAAVPSEVIRLANRTFANDCACRVYGSSEAPFISLGFLGPDHRGAAAETDGFVYDYEVRVVDDAGAILPVGETGEILVRGPALFLGYGEEIQTRDAFDAEGFFRTGDVGHLASDGSVTLTSRKKDLIIRGGENISAKEIEDALHCHPDIVEAAVVAMPHERMGEAVCAFLIVSDGATIDLAAISALLTGHGLARQKFPERIERVTELPRTASGKVRKDQLRSRIAAMIEAETLTAA